MQTRAKKDHGKGVIKTTSTQQTGTTTKAAPAPAQPAPGKQDTKNVADGAAKGQASEGIAPDPNGGGKGTTVVITKTLDKASPVAFTPNGDGKNDVSANDHKNISDGAAKGQATDGIVQNPNSGGGKGNTIVVTRKIDMASPSVAGQPNAGGKKTASAYDTKSVADGAAKGQASEGVVPDRGGNGGNKNNESADAHKNISDGAAKGQATDGVVQNPNSKGNGKSSTSVISVDGLEHSHETVSGTVKKPPVGGGGSDNPVESVTMQAPKTKPSATGTTDTQPAADSTTKTTTDEKK